MTLDTVLDNFQRNVPGCVAAGVVDIDTAKSHGEARTGLSAATTGELVQGQDVAAIEDMFRRIRGTGQDGQRFDQIVIFSKSRLHLFSRCRRNPNMVLATVCRKDASLGVVMAKSRSMLEVVDLAI